MGKRKTPRAHGASLSSAAIWNVALGHLLSDARALLRRGINLLTASARELFCRDISRHYPSRPM